MKTKQRKLLLVLLILVGLLGGGIALLARPGVMQTTSPDGRLIARVSFPSVLTRLKTEQDENWGKTMRVQLHVTDTKTGERVETYEHTHSYLFGDGGEHPRQLTWSSDSKQLTYKFAYEPGEGKCVIRVKINPLQTHILHIDPSHLTPRK